MKNDDFHILHRWILHQVSRMNYNVFNPKSKLMYYVYTLTSLIETISLLTICSGYSVVHCFVVQVAHYFQKVQQI
jgi:hypothetical protein